MVHGADSSSFVSRDKPSRSCAIVHTKPSVPGPAPCAIRKRMGVPIIMVTPGVRRMVVGLTGISSTGWWTVNVLPPAVATIENAVNGS